MEHLNATSVVPIMEERQMLTAEDLHIINSAATEYQKNSYILRHVQDMDNSGLLRFCNILQRLDHQQHVGMTLINGNLCFNCICLSLKSVCILFTQDSNYFY